MLIKMFDPIKYLKFLKTNKMVIIFILVIKDVFSDVYIVVIVS